MIKIAFYNTKGGSAKSTSCVNLAHALALQGKHILVCDLDPQASASFHFGLQRNELLPSITNVLFEELPIEKVIRKTSISGVNLVTADLGLSSFDISFASTKGREYKLKNILSNVKDYDFILIDPGPAMGLTALNVVVASDFLVIPTVPHHLNLQGLCTLEESLSLIRQGIGNCAYILGILLTQLDRRSKAALEILQLMRSHYQDLIFKTEIPMNTKLSEAPSHGKSIFQYDKLASGAKAYQAVAIELLNKLKLLGKINE
jgi:chromosome partitioning protein